MTTERWRLMLLTTLTAVLATCGGASGPSASPTTVPATASAPTPSAPTPSVGPSPSAAPAASMGLQDLAPDGTMFPGTYRTKFEPGMTITINDLVNLDCSPGYRCRGDIDVNIPNWVGLEFGNVHGSELDVTRLDQVCTTTTCDKPIDPPADLAKWLAARPGMTQVTPARQVTIGGIAGTRLDVRIDQPVSYGPTGIPDLPTFGSGGGGARAVLMVLNARGRWVVISEVLGPDNTVHDFDTVVAGLEPVVNSIRWE